MRTAGGTNSSRTPFVIINAADRLARVVDVEDVADVLSNEPRLIVVHDGAHRAFFEPEFGWQADDVFALAVIPF